MLHAFGSEMGLETDRRRAGMGYRLNLSRKRKFICNQVRGGAMMEFFSCVVRLKEKGNHWEGAATYRARRGAN